MKTNTASRNAVLRSVINIAWPSFLVAILAEGCFFSLFDPHELLELSYFGKQHSWPPIAAYTMGFFFFWMMASLASALTYYLNHPLRDSLSGRSLWRKRHAQYIRK